MRGVLRGVVRQGVPAERVAVHLLRRDGGLIDADFNVAPLLEGGKIVGAVATAEDVTERRYAGSLLAAQARLLELIAAGAPTLAPLEAVARMVEEHAPGMRCAIWYRHADQDGPALVAAPTLPGDIARIMHRAVAGAWGEAARAARQIIAADPATDPRWAELRAEVAAHGVASVWTAPILSSDGAVLGSLSMFGGRPGDPEDRHRRLVEAAAHLAGIVMERVRADAARRASEDRYRQVFDRNAAVKLLIDPETGRILDANGAAADFYGYSRDDLIAMTVFDLNQAPRDVVLRELERARSEERSYFQFQHRVASGEVRDIEIYAGPLDVDGRRVICSIIHDVSERKRTERQLASHRQLLERIAVGEPLHKVLDMLCSTVEELSHGALCSVLLVTEDGRHLRTGAAPSLPGEYNRAVDGVEIGPNVGSCGTAAFLREPVVVTDIADDALWAGHRDLALAHGLRSCWSTPIFASAGDVVGTFAVYYREPRAPDADDTALVRIATHVAGIAIERERAEEAARAHTRELEQLYRQLVDANLELEESKERLEEKSAQLEHALQLERQRARRDQLTGALNHAAITETLRDIVAECDGRPVAVAMVDVDGLKAANDTFGHHVGDAVLTIVARALERAGATVGRYGGDEFVAILPGADRPAAETYRQEVLASLAEARVADMEGGAAIPVVASIGVAIYPDEAEAVDDLIRLSDSAMYASRRRRAADGDGRALAAALPGDRAARMVGEIVPLLTSPGDLSAKLRLVSHRLSIGAGYDTVNFVLLGRKQTSVTTSTIEGLSERDYQAWDRRATLPGHAITDVLRHTRRPLIIDDVAREGRVLPEELAMLQRAGLRSALVAPMLWQDEMTGLLSVASRRPAAFGPRDAEFVAAVATQVTAIVRMASLVDELQASSASLMRAHTETVLMLAAAAEAHDQATGRHLQRVRGLTEALALELGHAPDDARDLGLAAVLHDIGKIRVPDMVLGSSAKLAESEWVLMKQHTIWGSEFLADQQGFELAAQVARSHHERWDGSGYPDGLVGEAIPESAQITAVADAFDAMTNDRPYRDGRPVADAVAEILACSGTQFSPRVVRALVRLYEHDALPFFEAEGEEPETRAA